MTMRKIKVSLLIILISLISACSSGIREVDIENARITRVMDYDAQVVCWATARGISCLPISDTTLPREKQQKK